MAIANIHIPAEITRTNYNRLLTMKQGDKNSRNLVIQLYEGGKPFPIESGASVRLNVKRPDGNVVQAVGSVNADGTVSAMLPAEALLIAGTIRISVSIFGANSAILTSTTIIMDVQEAEDVSEDITVFRSSGSTAAGNYYIIVAGTPYAFTTTSAVPDNGTIAFSADLTEANTYNASGAAIETGLTLTAGSATGTQLIAGPVATLIDSILDKMSGKQDALTAGTGITLVNNVISATGGEGLSDEAKAALLACFANVAWSVDNGQELYDDLYNALTTRTVLSITASFNPGQNEIYDTTPLENLRQYLTVTAFYSDGTSGAVTTYTLSGTLAAGQSEITVSYIDKITSFEATVKRDTTAKIAYYDKIRTHYSAVPNYRLDDKVNGAVTIHYEMETPTKILYPAGIIPTSNVGALNYGTSSASLMVTDASDVAVSYVNELTQASFNRWAQNVAGTMTEYSQQWTLSSDYYYVEITIDIRYIDDAYMYDKTTGQIWFAGKNTQYFGMTNVSEASA